MCTGEKMKRTDKIVVLGNYHKSNHEASRIIYGGGIVPTLKENHGTVNAVLVRNEKGNSSKQR